jgi:hypothetical protein
MITFQSISLVNNMLYPKYIISTRKNPFNQKNFRYPDRIFISFQGRWTQNIGPAVLDIQLHEVNVKIQISQKVMI